MRILVAVIALVIMTGCTIEAEAPEIWVTAEGLECVGFTGITCNWEKFNKEATNAN